MNTCSTQVSIGPILRHCIGVKRMYVDLICEAPGQPIEEAEALLVLRKSMGVDL